MKRTYQPSKRSRKRQKGGRNTGGGGPRIEIYVGNLSYDVTERDLQKAFARYGKVLSSRIIKDRRSGKSKGFGFIEMGDRKAVNEAIDGLDGTNLKGRRIVANEAKSNNGKRR